MVNKQGQTRLAQYYETMTIREKNTLESEMIRKCLARGEDQVTLSSPQPHHVTSAVPIVPHRLLPPLLLLLLVSVRSLSIGSTSASTVATPRSSSSSELIHMTSA